MADHWKLIANRLGAPGVDDSDLSTDGSQSEVSQSEVSQSEVSEVQQPTIEPGALATGENAAASDVSESRVDDTNIADDEAVVDVSDEPTTGLASRDALPIDPSDLSEEELSFSKPLRSSLQLDLSQPEASREAPPAEESPRRDDPESVPVSEKPAEKLVEKPKAKKRRSSWEALASMFNVPIERSQPEPEESQPEIAAEQSAADLAPEPVNFVDKEPAEASDSGVEFSTGGKAVEPQAEADAGDTPASLDDSDLSFGKSRRGRGRSRGRGGRGAGETERLSMFQAAEEEDSNNPALEAMFPAATAEASDSWGGKKRIVDDVNWEEDEDDSDVAISPEPVSKSSGFSSFDGEDTDDGEEPVQRRSRRRRRRGRRGGSDEAQDESTSPEPTESRARESQRDENQPISGRDDSSRDDSSRDESSRRSSKRTAPDRSKPRRGAAAERAGAPGGKRDDDTQDDDPWGSPELYVESSVDYDEPDSFEADTFEDETLAGPAARRDSDSDDDEGAVQRRSSRRRRRGRSRSRDDAAGEDRSPEPTRAEAKRSGFDELADDVDEKSVASAGNGRTGARDDRDADKGDDDRGGRSRTREGGRRRRRRSPDAKQQTDETVAVEDDAGGMEEFDSEVRSAGSHRNIPTWQDSIESIVAANAENHKRSGNRGGGPRGRSRGRR